MKARRRERGGGGGGMTLLGAPVPIVPALFVAFLAAGTGIGFYLVRMALDGGAGGRARPNRAAATEARFALDEIDADALGADTAIAIGQVLRTYLDARFGLDTERLPCPDIERAMTRAGCARATGRRTAHLLERCDAAANGAVLRDSQSMRDDVRLAREIVDLTA